MRFGSVCSGIEAASVAWAPLGWTPAFFSEIAAFPSRLLRERFPHVPNLGDLNAAASWPTQAIDVLIGGTPCQSFSVAGLRGGLADPRGQLTLAYLRVVDRFAPRWVVWENVPGVLSSGGGRDFGAFLGGLAELGYRWTYRVLDAQHFGVPQRRRRVFVVGHRRTSVGPAAVLLEPESLPRRPPPRGGSQAKVARTLATGTSRRYDADTENFVVGPLTSSGVGVAGPDDNQARAHHLVVGALLGGGKRGHRIGADEAAAGHLVAWAENSRNEARLAGALVPTLPARGGAPDRGVPAVLAFHTQQDPASGAISPALGVGGRGSSTTGIASVEVRPRRLTPEECERLQGFPTGWTAIKDASDSARYAAIGNSMAVPVVRWIGERIQSWEAANPLGCHGVF